MVLHLKKNWIPFTQGCFVLSLVELAQWFGRKRFSISSMYICYLVNIYPLHLNKLESPLPMDALCQVCLKLVQWFMRRFFKIRQCIFTIHLLLSLEKRRGPLFKQFLIFLDQRSFEPSLVTLKLAHWVWRRYLSFINVLIYTTF